MEPLTPKATQEAQSWNFPTLSINSSNEIETAINSTNIQPIISDIQHNYQIINIPDTFTNITTVGHLFQLSYSASIDYAYSSKIINMILAHQSLTNNCAYIVSTFVETSIKAFNSFNRFLFSKAMENEIPKDLKIIYRTIELAAPMSEPCAQMIVFHVANCNIIDKNLIYFSKKKYEEIELEAKLKNSTNKNTSFKKSIKSLKIIVNCLGKIRAIMENTRLFWLGLITQCKALADCSHIQECLEISKLAHENKIKLINAIKFQGLNWLVFADINRRALMSIQKVKESIDKIFFDEETDAVTTK